MAKYLAVVLKHPVLGVSTVKLRVPKKDRGLRKLRDRVITMESQRERGNEEHYREAGRALIAEYVHLPALIIERFHDEDCVAMLRGIEALYAEALGIPLASVPVCNFGFDQGER